MRGSPSDFGGVIEVYEAREGEDRAGHLHTARKSAKTIMRIAAPSEPAPGRWELERRGIDDE
jgi:hypothetical protein